MNMRLIRKWSRINYNSCDTHYKICSVLLLFVWFFNQKYYTEENILNTTVNVKKQRDFFFQMLASQKERQHNLFSY